jgi:sugar lactone lactonase YvrE
MDMDSIERSVVSEPFLDINTVLGEGPFYRPEDDTLHFVDIKAKLMYCVPLSNPDPPKVLKVDDSLGVACLIENDQKHYIVAAKRGFGLVDQETGKLNYLAKVHSDADQELRLLDLIPSI